MFHIVLMQPEIPMNTGNIARTCAATSMRLHLVGPLGFDIGDRAVKRAGLDYWHLVDVRSYEGSGDFFASNAGPFWFFSTKAPRAYTEAVFRDGDYLVFGRETAGLDEALLRANRRRCLRIPMVGGARSLNLSNSVAVAAFEALRQTGFRGLDPYGKMAGGDGARGRPE